MMSLNRRKTIMKHTFKKIAFTAGLTAMLINCGGRTPNPVMTNRPYDVSMTCASLINEMDEMQANINRLLPDSEKTGKNVALGVTGAFLIVPLFFMDFSDAEKIEIESYRARYNHLARMYNEKKCGIVRESLSEFKYNQD